MGNPPLYYIELRDSVRVNIRSRRRGVMTDPCPAIGIDLGTSFSCVGVFRYGEIEIIPNDQVQ